MATNAASINVALGLSGADTVAAGLGTVGQAYDRLNDESAKALARVQADTKQRLAFIEKSAGAEAAAVTRAQRQIAAAQGAALRTAPVGGAALRATGAAPGPNRAGQVAAALGAGVGTALGPLGTLIGHLGALPGLAGRAMGALAGVGQTLGGIVVGGAQMAGSAVAATGRAIGGLAATAGGLIVRGATAGGVALLGLGAIVGKTGVGFNALQEQALTAFTTILGGGDKAQALFDQLQSFAVTTPFDLPGIIQSSQHLLAFGFAAKDIIPDLTAIGNAVSATGGNQATLDRIVLALGQIKTKGKVQGDEMLQLTENNIAAWQYLADFLHTDIPNAQKMVSKGKVSADTGIQAILQGLAGDPKFKNAMLNNSHTWNNLVTNMGDAWAKFSGVITKPIFDKALKPGLEWISNWISGPGLALGSRIGQGLAAGMDRAARAFRGVMGIVGEFRQVLGGGMGAGGIGGRLAVGFLLIRDTITRRVIPAVQLLWRTFFGGIGGGDVRALFDRILMGAVNFAEKVGRLFQLGADSVVTFKQALAGDWFKDGAGNEFVNTIGRIGLALNDLWMTFQSGGFGAVMGKLWTDYAQPALENLWNGISGWVTSKVPLVKTQIGQWWAAFSGWATTQIPVVEAELGALLTAAQNWITNTGYPMLKTAAGNLWNAFTGTLTGKQQVVMPDFGLTMGLPGETFAGDNFLVTQINGAISGALAWVAGPGAEALGTLGLDLWKAIGTKIGPALVGGVVTALKDHWVDVVTALGALIENTTIPGLALKWAYPLGTEIGNAIWGGIKDTPLGAFFRWLNGGSTGLPGQGGAGAGTGTGPGLSPGVGGGGLGGDGGFTPLSSAPPQVNYNLTYINQSPITADDVARAHADMLLAAMRDGLGDGGGMVTA